MATIGSWDIIDKLIKSEGYYEDDPRVYQIVEYINAYGKKTWGISYVSENPSMRERYMTPSFYVNNPRIIWKASVQ